jgi:hypothetical protein
VKKGLALAKLDIYAFCVYTEIRHRKSALEAGRRPPGLDLSDIEEAMHPIPALRPAAA